MHRKVLPLLVSGQELAKGSKQWKMKNELENVSFDLQTNTGGYLESLRSTQTHARVNLLYHLSCAADVEMKKYRAGFQIVHEVRFPFWFHDFFGHSLTSWVMNYPRKKEKVYRPQLNLLRVKKWA